MKFHHIAAAVVAALALTGQASAATFEGATGVAANLVTDYSAGSLLSFDIDFAHKSSVTLNFRVEAADLASPQLSFNSLLRNLSGLGFHGVYVSLNGASFALPAGTIGTDGFVSVASSGANSQAAWAAFSQGLTTEAYLGNPLSSGGAADWTLSLAGRQVGDTFSVTVAVPEAQSYAMALAGLSVMGLLARRRSQA